MKRKKKKRKKKKALTGFTQTVSSNAKFVT